MEIIDRRQQPRSTFVRTLRSDPRWVGPYLAIAMQFLSHTRMDGTGAGYYLKEIAHETGMPDLVVRRVQLALVEQGYIIEFSLPGAQTPLFTLAGYRPEEELANNTVSTDYGPASTYIAEETCAWHDFQHARSLAYRAQRDSTE